MVESIVPKGRNGVQQPKRIALVHDYLIGVQSGERVFRLLTEMYPQADIFTLAFDRDGLAQTGWELGHGNLHASFMQHLPQPGRWFQVYLPLYPLAAESMDLSNYDLVISNSSAWAHGVRTSANATHVCYCYSPLKYAWSHYDEFLGKNRLRSSIFRPLMKTIRDWDMRASRRVDSYCAISEVVRKRIGTYYGRESAVIQPPIDINKFTISADTGRYYLVSSALIAQQRVDIAIDAFNKVKLPLVVVGDGPERKRLRSMAGPTVQFLGNRSDKELADLYSRCRALICPADDDFGTVPLAAMASGRPVLALAKAGALETILDGVTGHFFAEQTAGSLVEALQSFDYTMFDPLEIRRHAENFGIPAFKTRFRAFVGRAVKSKSRQLEDSRAVKTLSAFEQVS